MYTKATEMALATLNGVPVPNLDPPWALTLSHNSSLDIPFPKEPLCPQSFGGFGLPALSYRYEETSTSDTRVPLVWSSTGRRRTPYSLFANCDICMLPSEMRPHLCCALSPHGLYLLRTWVQPFANLTLTPYLAR
ncbi:hypothetical protein PHLGIDRAFT_214110 [Phlebiopsis gigantea 11061_1 CR5-6]|uniref:Uncharacterized protein n=1 Tax=Phlebiopsis gigantea (strain 11061_1 CR5-6) TaxID=745531 RepID=A0A0C3S699_PHLG1|nr:hypothetical protein PHLGIDRAFT_214110 [Phlebiopsis gigantea 11061_1 CR5-6]